MTDNTLSPTARAVFDAFCCEARSEPHHQREAIAAALRAAADQVAPAVYFAYTGNGDWDHGMEAKNDEIREAILAIATELETQ
jgi:hypothetical protein